MNKIRSNIDAIKESINSHVKLIAVTKTRSVEEINTAIEYGIEDIGENKVQEILEKYDSVLPVRWHMIGHLQTNKVKSIIDKVYLIHSVDSLKIAKEIDKRASEKNVVVKVLLQVNIAEEDSKYGILVQDFEKCLLDISKYCKNVEIKGIMCIAPLSDDKEEIDRVFRQAKELYDKYSQLELDNVNFEYLSMGMSSDYEIAIKNGANIIRVGSNIFGKRVY
ncbi:MAG: YggS family pyridoxal phosphate-dependent enzyme [Eubacteriales bacterium]|nr:YggS family pyridoxal phosphate-dependent enzyme [Eubacteriales bacterium]MDY3332764.1 YggS family pyridoxal phosphate-dependent enzyme [Gallibacter sp.]